MNILELDSYNLADAVKFNNELNPRIWQGQKMRPKVREKLLQIAADFKQSLGLSDLEVKDITVSGSNAGYTYTPNSDIDLHLVVDIPQADSSDVYRELFDAKKFQYNETHNITIGGYDVELYVENANEPPVSQGMYSVVKDDWINIPLKKRSTVNDNAVKSKYDVMKHRIESAIAAGTAKRLNNTAAKIKKMRQAGLDKHGELGPENLAYKMLRTQGVISKLYAARTAARDKQLSLKEQPKTPAVKYGFRTEDVSMTPDGVSPSTKMFLEGDSDTTDIVHKFIAAAAKELGITNMPKIQLHTDPAWSEREHSFGRYTPELHTLEVNLANRHIMDILRTTAHELVHCRQNQEHTLPDEAGETGSKWENQAHAIAGVLMRNFATAHPDMFGSSQVAEASGYIPTKKQKNDPRFSMALTVDVHPGQTGKEANKMSLQTDSQGKPALLMKTANLQESIAAEFEAFSESKSYGYNSTPLSQVPGEREDELGNQEATGPEFPPEMPAGTTKIDVKDLTDWYRLGMDISDMDDADPEDYNQGPPQTVVVFPSDEAEQGYLKQFKRLGLKTHDLDPDVEGGEDLTGKHLHKELAEEFALLEQEFLSEVKMTSKNLAKLASDIKGVKVGLEFEMIVPNAKVNDEDQDMEPDYDQDERVRSIDDAVNFFDDGDYNGRNQLRRLRDDMEEAFHNWQFEQIDEAWDNHGYEFFQEYLDREEPFDPEDYLEAAEDYVRENNPEIEPGTDAYQQAVSERLNEINAEYYVQTWEAQGRSYDNAREEFEEEKRDDGDFDEEAWLQSEGIRYASEVESNYGHVTWPYYTSYNDDEEADIERVALDFMNGIGASTVAYSSSYHGSYKKWTGDGWVLVGSEKPDDCFSIEPDGSLDGNSSDDVGLEFVSPPTPLEQVPDLMKRVQNWAGEYGVYTGKNNKTSIHTNISVPGYDLKNLDYLKAALLLGDEYVLREFDRIGNSYAKPAIEKVKQLVQQKPEKAQELLDKMKSQLNAEASKLIHSGTTDKFTSINTKNNRVEFRSPGGDYLSIIADKPQKMMDTINRMVVTLDAAMDPNKYKQEYQKKLYKVLTGQAGGREAKSGAKQEMKKDDKDLLNIFSRYAAGELPKQALKSFVRQAQLERKVKREKDANVKMWWNVARDGQRMEVVATNEMDAKLTAAREWGIVASDSNLNSMTVKPLRPYVDASGPQVVAQQPTTPVWGIWDFQRGGFVNSRGGIGPDQGRLIGGDTYDATRNAARNNGLLGRLEGGEFEIRQIPQEQPAQQPAARRVQRWEIVNNATGDVVQVFTGGSEDEAANYAMNTYGHRFHFTTRPSDGEIQRVGTQTPNWVIKDRDTNEILKAYHADDYTAAHAYLTQWKRNNNVADGDYTYGPISGLPAAVQRNILGNQPVPGSTIDLQRQRAAAAQQGNWGIWIINADRFANQPGQYLRSETPPLYRFPSREAAEQWIEQQRAERPNMRTDIEVREIEPSAQQGEFRSTENVPREGHPRNLVPTGPGPWEIYRISNGESVRRLEHTNRAAAEEEARSALGLRGEAPELYGVRTQQSTLAATGGDAAQGGIVDVAGEQPATAPRTLTVPGQGQQVFTGEWKVVDPNGNEIYRFGGVGNSQSDANRVAIQWLQRNPRHMQGGVEVLPVMG